MVYYLLFTNGIKSSGNNGWGMGVGEGGGGTGVWGGEGIIPQLCRKNKTVTYHKSTGYLVRGTSG